MIEAVAPPMYGQVVVLVAIATTMFILGFVLSLVMWRFLQRERQTETSLISRAVTAILEEQSRTREAMVGLPAALTAVAKTQAALAEKVQSASVSVTPLPPPPRLERSAPSGSGPPLDLSRG